MSVFTLNHIISMLRWKCGSFLCPSLKANLCAVYLCSVTLWSLTPVHIMVTSLAVFYRNIYFLVLYSWCYLTSLCLMLSFVNTERWFYFYLIRHPWNMKPMKLVVNLNRWIEVAGIFICSYINAHYISYIQCSLHSSSIFLCSIWFFT